MIRIWKTDQSVLLMGPALLFIDGVVESDAYICCLPGPQNRCWVYRNWNMSWNWRNWLRACQRKPKEAIAVQEVSFPEFKYTPYRV